MRKRNVTKRANKVASKPADTAPVSLDQVKALVQSLLGDRAQVLAVGDTVIPAQDRPVSKRSSEHHIRDYVAPKGSAEAKRRAAKAVATKARKRAELEAQAQAHVQRLLPYIGFGVRRRRGEVSQSQSNAAKRAWVTRRERYGNTGLSKGDRFAPKPAERTVAANKLERLLALLG